MVNGKGGDLMELNFKAVLAASGLTRAQLADAVGASLNSVDSWIAGTRIPRAETLILISKITGYSEREVITAIKNSKKQNNKKTMELNEMTQRKIKNLASNILSDYTVADATKKLADLTEEEREKVLEEITAQLGR